MVRLWDAILDPIAGYIADHTQTRWGRFRPYLLFLVLPMGTANFFLWSAWEMDRSSYVLYLYVVYILHGTLFIFTTVPLDALMVTMTQDDKMRSKLAGYKTVVTMVTTLLIVSLVPALTGSTGPFGSDGKKAFQVVVGIGISLVAVICYWTCVASTKERIKPREQAGYPLKEAY